MRVYRVALGGMMSVGERAILTSPAPLTIPMVKVVIEGGREGGRENLVLCV